MASSEPGSGDLPPTFKYDYKFPFRFEAKPTTIYFPKLFMSHDNSHLTTMEVNATKVAAELVFWVSDSFCIGNIFPVAH